MLSRDELGAIARVCVAHDLIAIADEAGRTLVRFAFCKRAEVIAEAVRRLSALSG
ncbi:MAG TPA: hypothetical protein VGF63_13230 [Solirubrobacteraceae bacterium]